MEIQEVKDHLALYPSYKIRVYEELEVLDKDKSIFSAIQTLNDYFGEKRVTVRAVALQTIYEIEAEQEEYGKLKRHGLSEARYGDSQVKFDVSASHISPLVLKLLGGVSGASGGMTGRLI